MNYPENLTLHVRAFFAGHQYSEQTWQHGPMAEDKSFRVARLAPGPKTQYWTYCSIGATAANNELPKLDFFILSPRDDSRLVELVTMVAYYHRTENLGLTHTFPIGEPWLDNSKCNFIFISLPYTFGRSLEFTNGNETEGRVLWLLPITATEHAFMKTHGVEALETKFEESEIEYWDVERDAVV